MYVLYSGLLFLVALVYFPVYCVKLRLVRRQPLHLRERLGFSLGASNNKARSVWIHAVSVGEMLSLQGFIKRLKQAQPDWSINLSVLTHSGYTLAREKMEDVDRIFFVPLDFKWIVRRFLRRIDPDVLVLAESEFWPNLLHETQKHTQAIVLVNGRISQRSCRRYARFRRLMSRVLSNVALFQVQTETDRERLVAIGGDPTRIEVTGNLKAEVALPEFSGKELMHLKESFSLEASHRVIVAGSTHRGEDLPLLKAFASAREQRPELRLILAPRHIERVREIEKLAVETGLKVVRRTVLSEISVSWEVMILDTLGDLARLYALSDVAFIGGSLIPWGGQNLLEPAFYGKPIYFGPHMDNFKHLAEIFMQNGAALSVRTVPELTAMCLMQDDDRLQNMGSAARNTLLSLQGAASRAVEAIQNLMKV